MSSLQVAGIVFPSFNSTNGVSVDVYFSGCNRVPKCGGCHNPLLWDFNYGQTLELCNLVGVISGMYQNVDNIAIMGGEPLHQPSLAKFLRMLYNECGGKPVWLYTSYTLSDIPNDVLSLVDFVKTGTYEKTLRTLSYGLASTNQKFWGKTTGREGLNFEEISIV